MGSASGVQILTLLADQQSAQAFMIELEQGALQLLTKNGLLVTDFLTPKDTYTVALQKFLDTNASALVIVSDSQARPIGVVDRDCLVLKLLLKLAN